MKFWMDKGVQGWRLDAVPHLIEDEELRDEHGNHDKTQNLPETYKIIEDFRAFIDAYSEENYVNMYVKKPKRQQFLLSSHACSKLKQIVTCYKHCIRNEGLEPGEFFTITFSFKK